MPPPAAGGPPPVVCPRAAVAIAAPICVLMLHVQVYDVLWLRARGVPQRHAPVLEACCHLGAIGAVAQARDHACMPLEGGNVGMVSDRNLSTLRVVT